MPQLTVIPLTGNNEKKDKDKESKTDESPGVRHEGDVTGLIVDDSMLVRLMVLLADSDTLKLARQVASPLDSALVVVRPTR
jgi:hypothetical protein